MRRLLALLALLPLSAGAQRPAPRPHPLPVVGATREHFAAIDAVTIGDRIFVAERAAADGWLRVYDASDVANPFEIRDATAPVVGRPLAVAGDGDRVLVASATGDTTRVRLTLFGVGRADRSRWIGAASLPIDVRTAGVEQMQVVGSRAVVKIVDGQLLEIDLAQLERDFTGPTRGDETSPAARSILRALTDSGAIVGDDALLPASIDTAFHGGEQELWAAWDFLLQGQYAARNARRGALLKIHGQWQLDVVDAATHRIVFTTRVDDKQVNSIDAADSTAVLVNDLVRVGELDGRRLAVFNATIFPAKRGKLASEGAAILDFTDPGVPRVVGVDPRITTDTANLRYGWHPYVRDAVFARDAVVMMGYDSTWIARLDTTGRMTAVDATGRFAGRLVPGPDGTVLELSGERAWADTRRAPRADPTVPAIRLRTTSPRLAVREGPAIVALDDRGATTAPNRFRFEIVAPRPLPAPAELALVGASVTLPATARGTLLEARLPAGAMIGKGALGLALTAGGAHGRWIALAAPPAPLAAGTTRAFVALDDPFTGATTVIADSGAGTPTDAAFLDPRLRARLVRDSNATIFLVPGRAGVDARVVRRDRGRAELATSRATSLAPWPAPAGMSAVAALRHVGSGPRLRLSLCLSDALGKRVQQEFDLSLPQPLTSPPCGDAAAIRGWLAQRGAVIVEGPDAAVVVDRRHLPPPDTLVEAFRRKRWTTVRADVAVDSSQGWVEYHGLAREDTVFAEQSSDSAVTRPLTLAERREIARAVGETALLDIIEYAATDSTDSTVAVLRYRLTGQLLPGDTTPATVIVGGEQWGSMVVGDLAAGRFVPRWEAWGVYTTWGGWELVDLDGDGVEELVSSDFGHDAKGHVTEQYVTALDRNGRELTRQPSGPGWDASQTAPISTDVTDGEYCESGSDCGGFVLGRPAPDGSRPFRTSDGEWVLRDHRYVFRPRPPKPKPAPRKKPAPTRAPKKR